MSAETIKITAPKLKHYKKFRDRNEDKTGFGEMKMGALRKALGLGGSLCGGVTLGPREESRGGAAGGAPRRPTPGRWTEREASLSSSRYLGGEPPEGVTLVLHRSRDEADAHEEEEEREAREEIEEMMRREEEESRRKREEGERRRAEEEAELRRAAEVEALLRAREEAAAALLRRAEEEEAAALLRRRRAAEEEAALLRRRAAEEEAALLRRRAAEEEAVLLRRRAAEEEAVLLRRRAAEEEAALLRRRAAEEEAALLRRRAEEEAAAVLKRKEEEERREVRSRKVLCDLLSLDQKEFANRYQEILTIIRNCKDGKRLAETLNSDLKVINAANEDFINLVEYCKRGDIKETDVTRSSTYVSMMTSAVAKFKEEADKINSWMEEKSRREEEERNREMEAEEVSSGGRGDIPPLHAQKPQQKEPTALDEYWRLRRKLEEMEKLLEGFVNDEKMKKFRTDCRKAVNTPVNAMSAVSREHMEDKFNRLYGLLKGSRVLVGDKRFSASAEPLGVPYCMSLLAKKIVNQGEQVVSSKQDAAFPLAALASALWVAVPQFGELLLAQFQRVCPYLVPVYWERDERESEADYCKRLGFLYKSDGEKEELETFVKRMSGVTRLFGAMTVAQPRRADAARPTPLHPHNVWSWTAAFVNLEPRGDVSATLMLDMLEVTGNTMVKVYGRQFQKLLHILCKEYIPKVERVSAVGRSGPVSRLKSFLESIIYTNEIPPSKGLVPPHFW